MGWRVQKSCLRRLRHFRGAYGLRMTFLRLQLLPGERVKIVLVAERLRMLLVYRRWECTGLILLLSDSLVSPFVSNRVILLFLMPLLHLLAAFPYAIVFNVYVWASRWLCRGPRLLLWPVLIEHLIDKLVLELDRVLRFSDRIYLDESLLAQELFFSLDSLLFLILCLRLGFRFLFWLRGSSQICIIEEHRISQSLVTTVA